ncbi:hypothetical protein BCR41DRAFT_137786 [Lobosporangium transversale]|uniref:Transmembrane protein 230 n=1 Tax=Lobosporangium transversale TaxID=64571 RepID=A0A1Y2GFF7_9FUNG|nr:hypothetical protein BCR41DRAFT_137786 [Lobosporangium transversale]ORZ09358.1 hypothetical protein BCR41DRAFT_137786 [Lobosporangium transversale]|eukprot:XP_021878811.1 hypothetical protein BCR41DRAFT_137786 [Lobosporangium transversale]
MPSTATSSAHKPVTGVHKLVHRTKKMRFPRRARRFLQMQEDTGYSEGQFMAPTPSIPWKSIALAVVLLILGIAGLTIGSLLKVGIIVSPEWLDKGTPLLILGALCFIPGSYHVGLAYYAYKDYEGYSFSHIPDLDD